MTSFASEPSDITQYPIYIEGEKSFNALKLLATTRVMTIKDGRTIAFEQFFISIPSENLRECHLDIIEKAFKKFKLVRPISSYNDDSDGQEYCFVPLAANFRAAKSNDKFVEWDNERVEAKRHEFISLLMEALKNYINVDLSF